MVRNWKFYGRHEELKDIERVLGRDRWFFCQISGRRRIGKTALVTEALRRSSRQVFYMQVPDSDPSGVVQAFCEAAHDFGVVEILDKLPNSLSTLARCIAKLIENDLVVIVDEFQYFNRKQLSGFSSHLQTQVDRLASEHSVRSGLFILGSIHNEMMAILEDRRSPLFNRVTDRIELGHLNFRSLADLWADFEIESDEQKLFLWSLFEGVPKFYRDAFEQGVFDSVHADGFRETVIEQLFFRGSSPLRNEADNWFLNEFRGRYESLLKIVSRNNGCSHGTIMDEYEKILPGRDDVKQIGSYLNTLIDKYQIIEKRFPIFSSNKSRKARYYIVDNFLLSWLGAIDRQVKAAKIQPIQKCVAVCNEQLKNIEGLVLEKMVRLLVTQLSSSGDEDWLITDLVEGYWNRAENTDKSIEIDLVLVNEDRKTVRYGSCKRSPSKLLGDAANFKGHIDGFRKTKDGKKFTDYTEEAAAFSLSIPGSIVQTLASQGVCAYALSDLLGRIRS